MKKSDEELYGGMSPNEDVLTKKEKEKMVRDFEDVGMEFGEHVLTEAEQEELAQESDEENAKRCRE